MQSVIFFIVILSVIMLKVMAQEGKRGATTFVRKTQTHITTLSIYQKDTQHNN